MKTSKRKGKELTNAHFQNHAHFQTTSISASRILSRLTKSAENPRGFFYLGKALIPSPSPAPGVRGRRELTNIIPSPVRNERERVKARVLFPLP